ncbi:HK97 family phage prohead protease [Pseudomonadota bacterium]
MARITGLAVPYFSSSVDQGGFVEVIEPNAIKLEGAEIRALYEHKPDELLGRTQSKTLRLNNSADGVGFELDIPNTTLGNDLIELIKRGDLSGCSFQMFVESDSWNYDSSPAVRIIHRARIDEITITAQPAYQATTVEVIV